MRKVNCIIVDIDGTLADVEHRAHFVNGKAKVKDWDSFNSNMSEDTPKQDILYLVKKMANECVVIVLITGRFEQYREQTERWLAKYGVRWNYLFMRNDGDYRSDSVIKLENYGHLKSLGYNVKFVLEDRDSVVKMWREQGLTCLQVCQGDY